MKLTWSPVSDSRVTGYQIYRSTDGVIYDLAGTTIGRISSQYTLIGLSNGTEYQIKMRVTGSEGEFGAFTDPLTVTPTAAMVSTDSLNIRIATWNIEWFAASGYGPTDDAQQISRVAELIRQQEFGIVALQEIGNNTKLADMVDDLTVYDYEISSSYYNDPTQSIAILYVDTQFMVLSSSRLTTLSEIASRPPLEVRFSTTFNGKTETFYVIALHAKAGSDSSDYSRRSEFAVSLKSYIDTQRTNDRVIILGDYNDKLNGSIHTSESNSPYKNFVDSTDYNALTYTLNVGGQTEYSFPGRSNTIDHIIISNEMVDLVQLNSANVLQNEFTAIYSNYTSTVSDHFPVQIVITLRGQ